MAVQRVFKAIALLSLSTGPAIALEIIPFQGQFSVGSTRVVCTSEPCPRMGVVEFDNIHRDPIRPLWASSQMSRLRADPADSARIAAAWKARECLIVEGSFYTDAADLTGLPVLRVDSIVGGCP